MVTCDALKSFEKFENSLLNSLQFHNRAIIKLIDYVVVSCCVDMMTAKLLDVNVCEYIRCGLEVINMDNGKSLRLYTAR